MSTDGFRADWATKDFYAELGVGKDASAEQIKKAYRKLARANHPDSNPGDDVKHEKFKAVAEAYDVVGDPDKRAKYDEMRSLYASGRFPGGFGGGGGGGGGFDSTTCCATGPAGVAASATCSATSSAAASPVVAERSPGPPRVPTSRPRRRSASPTRWTASPSRCG